MYTDGGWLQKNEIPPGRGSFAVFDKLAQENKRIIRGILEPESHGATTFKGEASLIDYDQLTLKKLRGLYKSCLDEEHLNERGEEPLLDITRVVKQLFRGESLEIYSGGNQRPLSASDQAKDDDHKNNGLTAAIAYLHSRGEFYNAYLLRKTLTVLKALALCSALISTGTLAWTRTPCPFGSLSLDSVFRPR
jgi:endothelin-converting enzyme